MYETKYTFRYIIFGDSQSVLLENWSAKYGTLKRISCIFCEKLRSTGVFVSSCTNGFALKDSFAQGASKVSQLRAKLL